MELLSKEFYGVKHGFHNYKDCASCSDVDAISVSVSVPAHFPMVTAALDAGKHCFCEWPLGRNTQEALELAEKAKAKNLQAVCGLQSRGMTCSVHPSGRRPRSLSNGVSLAW